ncbi:MAG TPA: hypothetical protein VFH92_11030 [Phenylobacterium sp.]|nr:hypothetical protein [Phenylobacterium sp.]
MADPYARVRASMKAEIVARVAAGEPLRVVCRSAGMPCDTTVRNWRRADPAFAEALELAQANRAHRRFRFDPVRAEAFLARYRTGEEGIEDILRSPGMISRTAYARYLRDDPTFAEEIHRLKAGMEATRRLRFRRPRREWDRAIADRVLVRLGRGEPLKALARTDPTLPCRKTLTRWRRERPEFASEMAECLRVGALRRQVAKARRERLAPKILDRLVAGASLHSLSHEPGMPSAHTLYRWVREDPNFAARVNQACDDREEALLEAMLEIADAATPTTLAAAKGRIRRLKRRLGWLQRRPGIRGEVVDGV